MSLAPQQQIRVLHVDDEPDFADLTGTFLEREDDRFTIETATSADDGLEIINDRPPDCVVSDYNMPSMDGLEFLQAVREDNPNLPFILYTGKGSEAVASEAISLGVTDYLQKGSGTGQYELLANRISNAVEQHQAKRRVELSHQAMDTANEGLSLVRPDGTFSYVNSSFAQLFEYDPDELIGEHWTVLYHDEEAERLDNDILPAVKEHGYWSGETVRLTKQEDRLVTDHRLSRTAEDVIVCTAQDITPERTGSTRQSGELDLLVDTMEGHAFYTLDHEGYVTSWNEGAERLTGYNATEILGTHVGQFFTKEDRDRGLPEELIETAKTDGTVTDQGWRIRNDDSQIRTADTISASYDASGTIRGFGVMMRESTADPLAAELHRKTDYLDVIMEYSVQPLFMKDTSGEYLLANREYKQLFDIQDETVIGRTDYDLHPEEMAEEVWANDRHVLETDEPVEIEEHVVVEGEERTYLSSKVPVYFDDDSDDPDAVFGMATDITERKEREQEITRLNQLYQTILSNIRETVVVTDDDGQFTYICPNIHFVFGYEASEVDELETVEALLGERLIEPGELEATGEVTNIETSVTDKSGDSRTVLVTVRQVDIEDGSRLYSIRDITDRNERRRELERTTQYLEIVLETAGPAFLKRADGRYHLMNTACKELLGLDPDRNVTGLTDYDLFPDDVVEQFRADDKRVIEAGEPIEIEEVVPTADGPKTYQTNKRPLFDEEGKVEMICAVSTDITERKEREQKLELVETLFKHAQECQFIIEVGDGEFKLRHANDYYKRTVGLSPGEPVTGQTPTELFGDTGGQEIRDRNRECVETCESVTYTVEVPVPEEGTVYRTILAPVVSDGDVTHIVGTARDITDDKRREEKLKRQKNRLEEFASVVSHDLRNPLRMADGRVELLREECESEQIDDIAQALDRMDTLIEDLLTLAREGDQVGEVERVVLADLINDCWQNIAAPEAEILTDCDRTVHADRSRFQQLLENLLRNAVEHGGADVTVTIGEVETGFYVEDDGPGIPEENRDDVFEAGYSTSADGTGFGLRIVKQVADAHGWEITVSEGEQGGARFEVTSVEFADR